MKGKDALKQLILKRSRITALENEGYARKKRKIICCNCHKGHTILTCSDNCTLCNDPNYKKTFDEG